jgi:hypothetical protein
MKKTVSVFFELVALVVTLTGIIGLFTKAGEVIYRQRPPTGFIAMDTDFLSMSRNGKTNPLFRLLLAADQDHMLDKDGEALRELTRVIQDFPEYTKSHYYRGLIYLSNGYVEEGVADLQVVVEKSSDPELRRQADREILLARIAQALTPFPFLGLALFAALFIAVRLGVKFTKWSRAATIFVVVDCVIWASSLVFLFLH